MNYNEKSPDIIVFGITIYFLHSAHSISLNVSWTTQRIRQWNNMISENSCQLPFHIPVFWVSWARPMKISLFCFCRYRKFCKENEQKKGPFQFKYASKSKLFDNASNLQGGSLATWAFHQVTSSKGMLTHRKLTIEDIFDLLIKHGSRRRQRKEIVTQHS